MIVYDILEVIYELEAPIIKANDFDKLYVDFNDLLSECQQNIDPNLTSGNLANHLNELWLRGKILRFLKIKTIN